MSFNKYHARKVEVDGMKFDSAHEYKVWCRLVEDQRQGIISDLQRQVVFELIPKQELPHPRVTDGRNSYIESAVKYIADFTYRNASGEYVVADAKSPITRTKDYRLKRKLMLWVHHIMIEEL